MKKWFFIILAIGFVFYNIHSVFAQQDITTNTQKEPTAESYKSESLLSSFFHIKELGLFSGYGTGSLKEQAAYEPIFFITHIGFDLKPPLSRINFNPKGILEWYLEPQLNTVISPTPNNVEAGLGFGFQYMYPLTKKLYPYAEIGSGVIYLSQHTAEQSTQFNFHSQAGCGIYYFIKDNVALNVGYRFRHISNCSIEEPNSGINTQIGLAGVSLFY